MFWQIIHRIFINEIRIRWFEKWIAKFEIQLCKQFGRKVETIDGHGWRSIWLIETTDIQPKHLRLKSEQYDPNPNRLDLNHNSGYTSDYVHRRCAGRQQKVHDPDHPGFMVDDRRGCHPGQCALVLEYPSWLGHEGHLQSCQHCRAWLWISVQWTS